MEKSQQIKILTKGGEEVTLKMKEIFPLTDDQLTGMVDEYLPGYLTHWGHDDDLDYEPYNTIFNFLTGKGEDNYYTNLFYPIEEGDEDEGLEDELDDNGFTYNGKEYGCLMDLVDEWLNTNYPKAFATGLSILHAWEYWEASNYTEANMLQEMAYREAGQILDYIAEGYYKTIGNPDPTQTITFINGYKGESYMKSSKYITYEIKEEDK